MDHRAFTVSSSRSQTLGPARVVPGRDATVYYARRVIGCGVGLGNSSPNRYLRLSVAWPTPCPEGWRERRDGRQDVFAVQVPAEA